MKASQYEKHLFHATTEEPEVAQKRLFDVFDLLLAFARGHNKEMKNLERALYHLYTEVMLADDDGEPLNSLGETKLAETLHILWFTVTLYENA